MSLIAPQLPVAGSAVPAMGIIASLRRIGALFAPYPGYGGVIFLALLLEMGFTGLIPMSFKFLIDGAIQHQDRATLFMTLGLLFLALVVVAITSLGRDFLYSRLVNWIMRDERRRVFTHLQGLSMNFFRRAQVADILSCFSIDLAALEHAVSAVVPWIILPLLDIGLSLILMFSLDWRLALVSLFVLPASLVGPRLFAPRASRSSYRYKQEEADLVGHIQENLTLQPLIKTLNLERSVVGRFRDTTEHLAASGLRVSFLTALTERSANIGISFLQVVTIGVGAFWAVQGQISIGSLVSFQALLLTLSNSLSYFISYVPILVPASGGMQRIEGLLAQTSVVQDAADAVPVPGVIRSWSMTGVGFSYSQQPALESVTLKIPSGQIVAIVGSSGSGKSTLFNLLMRFDAPTAGSILFGGEDVRRYTTRSIRESIGFLGQEPLFFQTSIRENLHVGAPDATPEEVVAAAELAGIHAAIAALPAGYETPIADLRFSPAEWQRLALARVLMREVQLFILDEATDALDPEAEAEFIKTVMRVARGRTVLIGSNRVAVALHADLTYVLRQGSIAEVGSHDVLLKLDGLYAGLWRKQSGFVASPSVGTLGIQPERLSQLPLFEKLDPTLLREMASRFRSELRPAQHEVFQEGASGDRFYIIARGCVEVIKQQPDGTESRIAVLEDGDHFGEIALTMDERRNATVRTLAPCQFVTLDRAPFLELMEQVPEFKTWMRLAVAERSQE